MKRSSTLFAIALIILTSIPAFAEVHATESGRIRFARGAFSAELTGSVSGNEIAGYVFGARKGQVVTVSNPRAELFSFNLFNDSVTTEDVYEPTFEFVVPETGDYTFYVKKMIDLPRTARYSLTLTIR